MKWISNFIDNEEMKLLLFKDKYLIDNSCENFELEIMLLDFDV